MTTLEQASFPVTPPAAIRLRVQRQRRRDVRQVSQPLRKVTQHLLRAGVVLLGKQSQVIRCRGRLFEGSKRLPAPALPGQAFHQPEGTREKGAFPALQAVHTLVAQYQAVAGELPPDYIGGPHHALVVERDEIHTRQQQQRRIHLVAAIALDEDAALVIHAVCFDVAANFVPPLYPTLERRG